MESIVEVLRCRPLEISVTVLHGLAGFRAV